MPATRLAMPIPARMDFNRSFSIANLLRGFNRALKNYSGGCLRRCAVLAPSTNWLLCLSHCVPCVWYPAFLITFFTALLGRWLHRLQVILAIVVRLSNRHVRFIAWEAWQALFRHRSRMLHRSRWPLWAGQVALLAAASWPHRSHWHHRLYV